MKFTVLVVIAYFWMDVVCLSAILDPELEEVLEMHNFLRAQIGKDTGRNTTTTKMNKLYWDEELALEAQLWASHCSNIGRRWRVPVYTMAGIPLRGMNQGAMRKGHLLRSIVLAWWQEQQNFHQQLQYCHYGKQCEAYMQLANADTDRIGCAVNSDCTKNGERITNLVCFYSPGVSLTDDPVYTLGETCTHCVEPASFCNHGLCDNCNRNHEDCVCLKCCGSPGVGAGILNPRSCTCSCKYGDGPNCDVTCENPVQYSDDYDICSDFLPSDCESPDVDAMELLHEFCPSVCKCKPYPGL